MSNVGPAVRSHRWPVLMCILGSDTLMHGARTGACGMDWSEVITGNYRQAFVLLFSRHTQETRSFQIFILFYS